NRLCAIHGKGLSNLQTNCGAVKAMIFFDIDSQHDFMDRGGALYTPDSETIKPNLELLLRAAGEYRITTISSRCAHVPNDPEFAIFPPHCIDGTYGAE